MNIEPIIVEISKLSIKDGDYLVLKFPEITSQADVVYARTSIHERFPELSGKIMVLWGEVEIYVVEVKDK